MNTRRFFMWMPLVVLTAIGAGCGHHEAELAQADLEPISVATDTVETFTASDTIEVRGLVQPARQSFVSSRVMGPVVNINVAAGDTVKKGAALLQIEPATAEGQVNQAQGALAQAKAALALAERNHQRYEALHGEGAASDLELDMAKMQLDQARGAVRQAEGAVQAASSVADDAHVRAPFAARVIDTLVEVGDMAAPGRPLVRVESLGGQQLWLTVREADIHRLKHGDRLLVTFDARPDLGSIESTVSEVAPSADPATHTFTVKVDLGDTKIATGVSGRAQLTGDSRERLVIPASAVHHRGGLELVVVRAEDGTARTRAVTTGKELSDGRIEVLSGLNAGETIAVDAAAPVPDGTPLEVTS
jgi:RND family efflux transporter MFP subunit